MEKSNQPNECESMSQLKYCQGPKCHTYDTKDRLKGQKDNKTFQTRRRSDFYYGNHNFCDQRCLYDWFHKFGEQAINHFGKITQPKVLTQDNAWQYRRNWNHPNADTYYAHNYLTDERRPLTQQQYDNEQVITIDGRLAI